MSVVVVESLDAAEVSRCRQILRTVPSEVLEGTGPELWKYPEPEEGAAEAAPPAGEGASAPLEAEADNAAGGLFLSHAWGEPSDWSRYFGAQPFATAKSLQVKAAVQRAAIHGLGVPGGRRTAATDPAEEEEAARPPGPRVWMDCASLPDPVGETDHPLDEPLFGEYGPYAMSVQDLKALCPKTEASTGYTILRLPEGHCFEGTMQIRKFIDEQPQAAITPKEVKWEILPGWFYVRSGRVIAEDKISEKMADEKPKFRPQVEQVRRWCMNNRLRDEVWVEITLGTVRGECLLLAETMLAIHGGLVAVLPWNYFDRLWPLCEWAVFCAHRGPHLVELAADSFMGPALVEYHRALRRLSVSAAGCRDPRDRVLLFGVLDKIFKSKHRSELKGFQKPHPAKLTVPVHEIIYDFSAVERYIRVTAIAVFAHEAAPSASREPGGGDEAGWAALAEEFGFSALWNALKKCKPHDWWERAKHEAGGDETNEQAFFEEMLQEWWTRIVLPVLEDERKLAMR